MNGSISFDNSTIPVPAFPVRGFFVSIFALGTIATVFLHGSVLVVILRHRNLRTPFNMYVVNLLIVDLVHAVTDKPMSAVQDYFLSDEDYPGHARMVKTFFTYILYCVLPATKWAHVLISVNRIWALTFPVHYSHRHTVFVAVAVCLASFFVIQTMGLLVAFVSLFEFLRRGLPMFNIFCALFIVSSYPYLYDKHQRYTKKQQLRRPGSKTVTPSNQSSVPVTTLEGTSNSANTVDPFAFLTALTLVVFFAWVPTDIYYAFIAGDRFIESFPVHYFGTAISGIQTMLDGIFFVFALRDIKATVKSDFLAVRQRLCRTV